MLKFIYAAVWKRLDAVYSYYHLFYDAPRAGESLPASALPPEVLANIGSKISSERSLVGIMTQYFSYLKQLAHGDFGPSFK